MREQVRSLLAERAQEVVRSSLRACGPLAPLTVRSDKRARGKIILYLFEKGALRPSFVVKLARTPYGRNVLLHERDVYAGLASRSALLRDGPPRVYCDEPPLTFALEPFVAGGPVAVRFGHSVHEELAVSWLVRFHHDTRGPTWGNAELLRLIDHLSARAPQDLSGVAASLRRWVERTPFAVPSVPVHGDFTPSNLLLDGGLGFVVDWEWAAPQGWPLEDLWTYLLLSARRAAGGGAGRGSMAAILSGEGSYARRLRWAAHEFSRRTGYPASLHPAFAVLVLFRMAVGQQGEGQDWREGRSKFYRRVALDLDGRQQAFRRFWLADGLPDRA